MNKTQLTKLIREEIKNTLNEGAKENKVANLYAWAGINTKYSNDAIERFGQATVDQAIEMAPKIIAFKKKLKSIQKEITSSEEGKMLLLILKASKGYGGDHSSTSPGDIFNMM